MRDAIRAKITVIMPAYNAEKTLERTVRDIPPGIVSRIILVDDCSKDNTVAIARRLGLDVYIHNNNIGYGGNQKTCYTEALKDSPDIIVMVHPDYQYDATKIPELVSPILKGEADAVFGSRLLGGSALEGGMPLYKYISNKFLTFLENIVFRAGLSEYHTGFRAYSSELLRTVPWERNSNDFVFDTEIIAQIFYFGFRIKEIGISTRYFEEASSINFWKSMIYGFKTVITLLKYILHKRGIMKFPIFEKRV